MTNHRGLEVQSKSGVWIPVSPIAGTLVINGGRALEYLTGGVCPAAIHRVNLRPEYFYENGHALGPRYSCPVFQNMRPTVTMAELTSLQLPRHIKELAANQRPKSDSNINIDNFLAWDIALYLLKIGRLQQDSWGGTFGDLCAKNTHRATDIAQEMICRVYMTDERTREWKDIASRHGKYWLHDVIDAKHEE
ncbi:hypothetical protein PWT90_10725 [Aphanocladium album]|nr:hypothetical protein PWT90_10725 [Aphanocladium album]